MQTGIVLRVGGPTAEHDQHTPYLLPCAQRPPRDRSADLGGSKGMPDPVSSLAANVRRVLCPFQLAI
jgi:hypothetical protein